MDLKLEWAQTGLVTAVFRPRVSCLLRISTAADVYRRSQCICSAVYRGVTCMPAP